MSVPLFARGPGFTWYHPRYHESPRLGLPLPHLLHELVSVAPSSYTAWQDPPRRGHRWAAAAARADPRSNARSLTTQTMASPHRPNLLAWLQQHVPQHRPRHLSRWTTSKRQTRQQQQQQQRRRRYQTRKHWLTPPRRPPITARMQHIELTSPTLLPTSLAMVISLSNLKTLLHPHLHRLPALPHHHLRPLPFPGTPVMPQ